MTYGRRHYLTQQILVRLAFAGPASTETREFLKASTLLVFGAQLQNWLLPEFAAGAAVDDAGITIDAPEIAENGENVPVEVDAPGAVAIMLLAPGNPTPRVIDARFGELSGAPRLATRLRLGETQEVTAYAQMADGSYKRLLDKWGVGGAALPAISVNLPASKR